MRLFVLLLAIALSEARPNARPALFRPGRGYIINGENAAAGEFPWQLSQQRDGTNGYAHSCGASLLSANYALSAAHCLDGAEASILRVVAGLHDRTDETNGVASLVTSYLNHANYDDQAYTFNNDIAIMTLTTPISSNGGTIQYATLPADNSDQLVGQTCVMSGWGRTDITQNLPEILQKASVQVMAEADCNTAIADVSGSVGPPQICVNDAAGQIGSCNGDSGGPLNCAGVVAGVTSWGVSGPAGRCLTTYPSMYTRTSFFLQWIADNTP